MTAPALPVQRRPSIRFIVDSNPLFLLSAVFMLLAARLISAELADNQSRLGSSLFLLGMLNFYELLLIALGLFLIRRPASRRDGKILLIVEAIFLADFSFVNSELFTVGGTIPAIICIAGIVVAAVKLWFILRGLELGLDRLGLNLFIFVQLAAIFSLPGYFGHAARHNAGALPIGAIYAAWWGLSLLLLMMSRLWKREHSTLARLYLVVPLLSLAAHLGVSNWVYWQTFMPANASPALLVLAILLKHVTPSRFMPPSNVRILQLLLIGIACVLTVPMDSRQWVLLTLHSQRAALTPFTLTLAMAYATLVCCLFQRHAAALLATAATAAGLYLFGPSWDRVESTTVSSWTRSIAFLGKLIPKTLTQWGILSAAVSFALLGIGAANSARKRDGPNGQLRGE